ncbi:hypothetical protein HID58_094188 [Brassica napus]|uniref:Uncharacterized protein n=1 Tax=Brassica napus TaxID=3708 RepID=A0ABQ7X883_BRANA|nr:hypothetical protein HID58_094188 [Brassica napus]
MYIVDVKAGEKKVLENKFRGGENARSIKASAGRSSEVMEKTRQHQRRRSKTVSPDEVVKLSPHAVAIRDVEDEELRSFSLECLHGSQFDRRIVFYRVAVQGDLSDMLC